MPESDPRSSIEPRVQAYLTAVEQALAARNVPAAQRQNVIADAEAHIREKLSGAPSAAEAEAVLARLDEPEWYAEQAEDAPAPRAIPVAPISSPMGQGIEPTQPPTPCADSSDLRPLILGAVGHFALFMALLLVPTMISPRYAVVFRETDFAMPPFLKMALVLSDFAARYWWGLIPAFLAVETAFVVLLFHIRDRLVRVLWLRGLAWMMIFALALWVLVLMVPLMRLASS